MDRPFTYELGTDVGAGLGSLVRVRFHGKLTRGWVLGPTVDAPAKLLPVMRLVSPVPAFDERLLRLARWISERYVVPLASVIDRLGPPRVAGEESAELAEVRAADRRPGRAGVPSSEALSGYRGAETLLAAIASPAGGGSLARLAPGDEAAVAVELVRATIAAGRRAIVVVPEASPLPATAAAVLEAFGDTAGRFVGGDRRTRYRRWLEIRAGVYEVVVGTRPAVFAPLERLGAIVVMREGHPALREDRAPYTHVRDVALARARLEGATAVLAALSPSVEAASLGLPTVLPDRRRWPPVEVVAPAPEGRARRLVTALRDARRGFLYAPLPGAGVAHRCRTCGAVAMCGRCGGVLRLAEGRVACTVCEAPGACGACGGTVFEIRSGGAERVEAWAGRAAHLDLVGILDADLAERRAGLGARQRALTTWMEAVSWAWPGGRAIVQSARPSDPAIQALVRGNPDRFHADERVRREGAGFPVGSAVFRVAGAPGLERELAELRPRTMLTSEAKDQTVCLLALDEADVPAFGRTMRARAARGEVTRVEADPHL